WSPHQSFEMVPQAGIDDFHIVEVVNDRPLPRCGDSASDTLAVRGRRCVVTSRTQTIRCDWREMPAISVEQQNRRGAAFQRETEAFEQLAHLRCRAEVREGNVSEPLQMLKMLGHVLRPQ